MANGLQSHDRKSLIQTTKMQLLTIQVMRNNESRQRQSRPAAQAECFELLGLGVRRKNFFFNVQRVASENLFMFVLIQYI